MDSLSQGNLLGVINTLIAAAFGTGGVTLLGHFIGARDKRKEAERKARESDDSREDSMWDRVEGDNSSLREQVRMLLWDRDHWRELATEYYFEVREIRHECNEKAARAYALGQLHFQGKQLEEKVLPFDRMVPMRRPPPAPIRPKETES